jgi:hypothetical protein
MAECRLRKAGGGVSMVGEVMTGGGFWILGSFGEEGRRRGCTAGWKMRERGRESDLKGGPVRPKNECGRTYISTFNRTRAGAWV